jgi:hypothetical protein
LTAAKASGSLRHVKAKPTAVRHLAVGLAVLLQLVSAFGVSAGAVSILAATDPVHRVAVRICGTSLDLVLAHDHEGSSHVGHALPAFEQASSEPSADHGDHVLRCASTDSSAAPARAPAASGMHATLGSSTPFQSMSISPEPIAHPFRPAIPSALASLRQTILRI